jgi:hypothetical protein
MFSDQLIPNYNLSELPVINCKFVKSSDSCTCNICSSQYNIGYTTYIYEKCIAIKTCYLCHVIVNFKKYHSNKIFLIKSKMSQVDINRSILEYYSNYRYIPNPTQIDKSCKLIINTNISDFLLSSNKDSNVKIYFNPNVLKYLFEVCTNLFIKQKIEEDTTLSDISQVVKFYNDLDKMKHEIIKIHVSASELEDDITISDLSLKSKMSNIKTVLKIKKELAQLK